MFAFSTTLISWNWGSLPDTMSGAVPSAIAGIAMTESEACVTDRSLGAMNAASLR